MQKYTVALFIGRFQPFHNGHLYALRKAFELADTVIIGIGSSQESGTDQNPWNYDIRRTMVEAVLKAEGYSRNLWEICPIPDFPQDDDWAKYVENILDSKDISTHRVVGVGNNEWTNSVLKNSGLDVYETGLYNRDELEGVLIRKLLRAGDDTWKARVPPSIAGIIPALR